MSEISLLLFHLTEARLTLSWDFPDPAASLNCCSGSMPWLRVRDVLISPLIAALKKGPRLTFHPECGFSGVETHRNSFFPRALCFLEESQLRKGE
jgi:hypothetical protein